MVDESAGASLRQEGPETTAAQPLPLADRLAPCGPVIDAAAAERAREAIGASSVVERAWPALAPVCAASPYLARLAARHAEGLTRLLAAEPDNALADLVAGAEAAGGLAPDAGAARLRRLKAELHLLTALCDLGGVWRLDQVTG